MKKYLLTALLGVFGLFGAFASAENYSFVVDSSTIEEESQSYTPSSFTTDGGIVSNFNVVCNTELDGYWENPSDCYGNFGLLDSGDNLLEYSTNPYGVKDSFKNGVEIPAGTYSVNALYDVAFASVSFSIGNSSEGDSESGTLLPSGTGALSGIIENLGTTISEFIPYLVFIGLGLLGAIIGFVAIKWLMNRVRAKVYGTFSGGRRR